VKLLADALVVLVALLHVGFLVLEMVLWTRTQGRKVFGLDRAFAEQTRGLAANQGLYNGFLAAGLVWGLVSDDDLRVPVLTFFLGCAVVAGIFGALTVSRRIILVQAVPAILALAAVLLAG
jgi:putative membrane protein